MKEKILLVNICKEKLHYYEFVKPIVDIILGSGVGCFVKGYSELNARDLDKASKVIICGTSILDDEFLDSVDKFKWLLNFDKPVFGICGGMHLIGLVFGGKLSKLTGGNKSFLKKKTEIGYYNEKFGKEFLGLHGNVEVYHLHNNFVDFSMLNDFEVYSGDKVSQAVKHKKKYIYGVLFHPEVRQKEFIINFCN